MPSGRSWNRCCPPRPAIAVPVAGPNATTAARSSTRSSTLVDNGIKWRAMPADFPPWRTVYGLLTRWSDNLSTIALTDRLRAELRTALGRNPQPTAGCIDSQSVHESAEATVANRTSGFDPHKRVNGRKRHITVDTLGLLLCVVATPGRPAGPTRRPRPALRRHPPRHRPHLGRPRLPHRRLHRRSQTRPRHHRGNRPPRPHHHRPTDPAPPLGRRTHLRLDQPTPPLRPRPRTPHRPPRNHGPLGRHPHHDPPPSPPTTTHHHGLDTGSMGTKIVHDQLPGAGRVGGGVVETTVGSGRTFLRKPGSARPPAVPTD
jgi:transposase